MICTLLSRVLENFHRIPWTMFLAYFHAPGKKPTMAIYENIINSNKAFFTFSLISTSTLMHLFSRRDLESVPDSHVASKSVLFKIIFKLIH